MLDTARGGNLFIRLGEMLGKIVQLYLSFSLKLHEDQETALFPFLPLHLFTLVTNFRTFSTASSVFFPRCIPSSFLHAFFLPPPSPPSSSSAHLFHFFLSLPLFHCYCFFNSKAPSTFSTLHLIVPLQPCEFASPRVLFGKPAAVLKNTKGAVHSYIKHECIREF